MRLPSTALALLILGALGVATPAAAFNCQLPALLSPVKKTVCGSPSLRVLDQTETSKFALTKARVGTAAASEVAFSRKPFTATRDGCARDVRCLTATYNAQIRLYSRLSLCGNKGDERLACTRRVIEKHRMDLSRSL